MTVGDTDDPRQRPRRGRGAIAPGPRRVPTSGPTSGLLTVLDTAVLVVAILVGYVARFGDEEPSGSEIPYVLVAPGLVLAWLISLRVLRCYDDRVLGYGADEYRRVSSASLRLAGAIAIAGYIADVGVSRGFLGISFAVGTVGLAVARFAARKRLHRARDRGRRLVPPGAGRRRHRARAGAGAHAAPGAVRRVPGGRGVHPRRAARAGAAAARRRAGGRLVPGHPRGGRRHRGGHRGGHRLRRADRDAGCAGSAGSWRGPASTWSWPRR